MEQNESNIFEHGLDETAKAHLLETTRWTKFLAIMGFIFTGLLIIVAFAMMGSGSLLSAFSPGLAGAGMGLGMGIAYLFVALIYLYPAYALFKFSSCTKKGINTGNQELINDGFRHQKNMYRFFGIMLIILIIVYLLAFVLIGVNLATR
jgi:hypothetical protein